jgi:hypothetical protein
MTEGLGRKDGGSGWRRRRRRRATVLKRDNAALMYSEGVQPIQLAQGCFAGSWPVNGERVRGCADCKVEKRQPATWHHVVRRLLAITSRPRPRRRKPDN